MSDIESFLSVDSFAVAGASTDRDKYGNKVLRAYLQKGYTVYPIHPSQSEIEGQKAFANIEAAPGIDSLSIVTPPAITESLVDQAIAAGVQHLWMQPGAESRSAVERAQAAGLSVIAGGPCLLVVLGYRE